MKLDLSNWEIWTLLNEGSTNQKQFIKQLDFNEFEQVIECLEDLEISDDLRGLLNGGVLYVSNESDEYVIMDISEDKYLHLS